MFKKITIIATLFVVANCSSNNQVSTNPITGKKANPGIFSKDAEKGISLSDILSPTGEGNDNININGYLWRASLNILSIDTEYTDLETFGQCVVFSFYEISLYLIIFFHSISGLTHFIFEANQSKRKKKSNLSKRKLLYYYPSLCSALPTI